MEFTARNFEEKMVITFVALGKGGVKGAFVKILGALIQLSKHYNSNPTYLNSYTTNHQLNHSIKIRANGKFSNHCIRMRTFLKVIILNKSK